MKTDLVVQQVADSSQNIYNHNIELVMVLAQVVGTSTLNMEVTSLLIHAINFVYVQMNLIKAISNLYLKGKFQVISLRGKPL